jgi:hypothetical protein
MKLAKDTWCGLVDSEIELFRRILADLETKIEKPEGVEIGCMDGFSTAHILEATKRMHLTTIDPFIPDSMAPNLIGDEARFHANVEPWKDRITLIRDYSQNAVLAFDKPLDFLFIDGDHTYPAVMRDFGQWTPFLRVGSILAMHDSRMFRYEDEKRAKFHPGPSQVAMDEIFKRPDRWEILGETWALTIARQKEGSFVTVIR